MHDNTDAAIDQVKEMFPTPLYESAGIEGTRLCFVCGKKQARTALTAAGRSEPIVPLCTDCSAAWNMYGYLILRRIRPLTLLWNITKFYALNPFRRSGVWGDLKRLQAWQKRMAAMRSR